MSNFSFYYAHHMSTIEGGMISTNKKIYELSRVLRSHGMVREIKDKSFKNIILKNIKICLKVCFLVAFNMK